ncbi:OmpA family protein [Evansella cellulosilytica]|uniref:OmpA/MotB domain protein n=1 Tax=Evansella cellulosilytica (strain ATCC 21833 / DSM 2522 / FERM P-1141 / JCM 9156 / N-4) TaxID=649639 RepID=E6TYG7_EVAC2|nr:OmpA family protein [Evansella cellulosilytica]ADU28905.1 OmpA/MotB domain protein [Evansella cellulosilytica DSM 2522]
MINNKYKRLFKGEQDEGHFWPSFTDLLTAILLCFVLIFIVMMVIKSFQIEEMKRTIDQIMGVRVNIIEDLNEEFSDSSLAVEIDENTGALIFNTDILFEFDEAELKPEGFEFLDEFVPTYLEVLLEGGYDEYISEIIIEGHADRTGGYLYNLELSQERAFSVAEHILSDRFSDPTVQEPLKEKLTVNGRSYTDGRTDEEGNYSHEDSRRVEFKFRLRDEEILEKTRELLEGH